MKTCRTFLPLPCRMEMTSRFQVYIGDVDSQKLRRSAASIQKGQNDGPVPGADEGIPLTAIKHALDVLYGNRLKLLFGQLGRLEMPEMVSLDDAFISQPVEKGSEDSKSLVLTPRISPGILEEKQIAPDVMWDIF